MALRSAAVEVDGKRTAREPASKRGIGPRRTADPRGRVEQLEARVCEGDERRERTGGGEQAPMLGKSGRKRTQRRHGGQQVAEPERAQDEQRGSGRVIGRRQRTPVGRRQRTPIGRVGFRARKLETPIGRVAVRMHVPRAEARGARTRNRQDPPARHAKPYGQEVSCDGHTTSSRSSIPRGRSSAKTTAAATSSGGASGASGGGW